MSLNYHYVLVILSFIIFSFRSGQYVADYSEGREVQDLVNYAKRVAGYGI